MKYGLSAEQWQTIHEIFAQVPEVEQVILFGSRAMDTYKEASDIDLAVKGAAITPRTIVQLKDAFEDSYLPFFVDVVNYHSINRPEFKQHIDDKGVVIYRRGVSEWVQTTLGNVSIKIGSGATPTGGSNAYKETGISLIRSQNVLDFQFSNNGLVFLDDVQANELKNVTVAENDILLTLTGDSVARCCVVPKSVLPARVNQHVAIIRLNSLKANYRFIFYLLQAMKNELLMQSEIGATRKALTKGMIEGLDIFLPSIPEQKAIAAVLSSLDDKIDLLHRQNKTLEAMAETLFKQWFVIEAQDDWEEGCLGDIASFHNGKKRPDDIVGGNIPIYGGNGILGYSDNFNYEGTTVIIGRVGAYCGSLYIEHNPVWVSDNALVAKPIKNKHSSFLFFLLKYLSLNEMAEGSSHPLLTQTLLKSIPIFLPSDELIKNFVFQVDTWLSKINFNNNQVKNLESLRDTLLPKLMSGEVRV